jgi:116 kDa U5 small nuclear ribonucleoprotein component
VTVIGEAFAEDPEDMSHATVKGLWLPRGRTRVPMAEIPAGHWALIEGIDASILRSATVFSHAARVDDLVGEPKLLFPGKSVVRVAVEPVIPADLPKMVEGIRKLTKSYPSLETKVEESGEHVIAGAGEVFLDCALYDLRRRFTDIEVKVSDPMVKFAETVSHRSYTQAVGESPNGRNALHMVAEPLERGLAEALENPDIRVTSSYLRDSFGWDVR